MKRLNLYWGDSPMSWLRSLTVTSFLKWNPDWTVRIWTGKTDTRPSWLSGEALEQFVYHGKDYRDTLDVEWRETEYDGLTANLCADLTRWRVLSEGELWSDFDILYFNPIDPYLPVLSKPSLTCTPHFALGICGGGRPFRAISEHAEKMATPNIYQSAGVLPLYDLCFGTGYQVVLSRELHERLCSVVGRIEDVPIEWVHPFVAAEAHSHYVPVRTLGFHWYGGLALSQQLNAALTPENIWQHSTSSYLAEAITRVI